MMQPRSTRIHRLARVLVLVTSGSLAGAAFGQFIPNDPYFNAGTAAGPAEGYAGQWHLENQMPISGLNAGLDVNIAGAWNRGLTGAGVTISILDDGLEGSHPDLIAGFVNAVSWDYSQSPAMNLADSFRGSPFDFEDSHGTAVAGVAAARGGNGIGLAGAAPLANIASQRTLVFESFDNLSPDQISARAIGFQGQTNPLGIIDPSVPYIAIPGQPVPVRVMNHSYGPEASYIFAKDSPLVHAALETSASYGVVHVYSAGNMRNRAASEDANHDYTVTSPHQITVAALGSDGRYASYSNFGANVMVTAPSDSAAPSGQLPLATTDRTGRIGYNENDYPGSEGPTPDPYFTPSVGDMANYTTFFGGTSASAPLVAGIMALAVEANPDFDLRMARHLLARTSVKVDPTDFNWITNAAGYHFNKSYGFGLIDADALTLAAAQVESMSDAEFVRTPVQTVSASFGEQALTLSSTTRIVEADPLPLEYVRVTFTLSGFQNNYFEYVRDGVGAVIGDLSATLLSPSGTVYELFSDDRNLIGVADFDRVTSRASLEWTYLSNAYFGESLNGNWTVTLNNASSNTDYAKFGTWDSYQLEFGTGNLTLIPEPSVVLLVLIAGVGFLCLKRFRRA